MGKVTLMRVLLVEDDLDLREATHELLVEEGFDVDDARDGEQAWAMLEKRGPYDVIVLDLMMPILDGFEFRARQLASPHAWIPVVVVSAGKPEAQSVASLRSCSFISKPFDGQFLVREVRRCGTRPAA
jgi:DNA-binding response OmpR family regulator